MTTRQYLRAVAAIVDHLELPFFLEDPHRIPYCELPSLAITSICENDRIVKPRYLSLHIEKPMKRGPNHFNFFPSLDMGTDARAIVRELTRLNHTRDKHDTLPFHLWQGGDLSVIHMIIKCLCGQREDWMTPYVKYDSDRYHEDDDTGKKTLLPLHYDPWITTEHTTPLISDFKNYCAKYRGKIVLHVNRDCASAAWYLITYLIYAFATKITRKTISLHGVSMKIGIVRGVEIHGYSLTTMGDAYGDNPNRECKLFGKKYQVKFPSQIYKTSVEPRDLNRFWMPNA
jgi:hypothetical protein